jgi:hypothetical protein
MSAPVRSGLDILITNPRLVQTGLDLVDFPSIAWVEVDYSVYVLRQASRRRWRIGQRQPVEVTFLANEGTLQAEALGLVAAKTRASLMVEGELPEGGLAALGGDGGDVFLELARRLAEPRGMENQSRSLEALFADARRTVDEADDLLAEDGWMDGLGLDHEPSSALNHTAQPAATPFGELPLFPAPGAPAPSVSAPQVGKVVTFDELAHLLRRRRAKRKAVPEGQLALFGT